MAFKLTKGEETRLTELKDALDDLYNGVSSIVTTYNEGLTELRAPVDAALAAYNSALGELRSFAEQIASNKRNEFDEKSETWQEGDAGQEANEWIDAWENAELEEVSITFPDEITVEFDNAAEIDLSSEP